MDLLKDLQHDTGMGLVLITHDLGVVNEVADQVAVMYAGRIVERGTVDDVFTRPGAPVHRGPDELGAPGGGQGRPAAADHRPAAEPGQHPVAAARSTRAALVAGSAPQAAPGGDCAVDSPPLRLVVPGREAACHYSEEVLGV